MKKERIVALLAFIIGCIVIGYIIVGEVSLLLELLPQPYLRSGDRVYDSNECKYGYVTTAFDWPEHLPTNVRFDVGGGRQVPAKSLIKINNSQYLELSDFPIYPSPLHSWYADSFESWHCNPPINDIKGYCEDMYGNYSNRYTCYMKSDDEIVYYSVIALNVSIWRIQKVLNNKTNLNRDIIKKRKAHQKYHNFSAIEFSLLRNWMDYYGLVYDNHSLRIENFDEIKNNTIFMNQYCTLYGYAGYDIKRGCYRTY